MEPPIRYARTSDGVSIAYYTVGEGIPYVMLPRMPACHLQLQRSIEWIRRMDAKAAAAAKLVRYDARGMGLSERNIDAFPLDSMVADLEAVVDRLGAARVILHAFTWSAPVAIAFAARYPERLATMILWSGIARGSDGWNASFDSMVALSATDWHLATETWMRSSFGWQADDWPGAWAEIMREGITPKAFQAFVLDMRRWDVSALLPSVRTRTLLIHRRDYPFVSVESVQRLAAGIPRAELALLAGATIAQDEDGAAAEQAFFGGPELRLPSRVEQSGITVILFADIVDSTGLTERMGDAAFRERARGLDDRLRTVIREHAGTPVEGKLLGDGVLATFGAARDAIAAAVACGAAGEEAGLPLHLGLHAGDVIREGDNVFGGAVNIASRISGLSAPGEVLVSDIVRGLARTSAGVLFEDRGEFELKGIAEAQRVFAVRAASL